MSQLSFYMQPDPQLHVFIPACTCMDIYCTSENCFSYCSCYTFLVDLFLFSFLIWLIFSKDLKVLIYLFLLFSHHSILLFDTYCSIRSLPSDSNSAGGAGVTLAPIPACREDFSRMKLTSFDKLIEKTCSLIKNVRLCSEPDQRQGAGTGNPGVAPDAA